MDSISNELIYGSNSANVIAQIESDVYFSRTSELNEYIEGELEKIRDMTLEEIDAAADEAYEDFYVADQEAREASKKFNKALKHLHAMTETSETDSFMELNWIGSHQSLRESKEAIEAAIEESFSASRERRAAYHKVDRSRRLLEAIIRARDKRPITDCESGGASCSY